MLVQKGSASSTTSRLCGTMNNELTVCLGGTVWVGVQAVSVITNKLIVIVTTMHGFNSGIYLGKDCQRPCSAECLLTSAKDFGPPPFLLTSHDKRDFNDWSAQHTKEQRTTLGQCQSRRDTNPHYQFTDKPSVRFICYELF